MEEVAINFYRVHECGYYNYGDSSFAFCDLNLTLRKMSNWVLAPDMALEDTCTYAPCSNGNYLRSFCNNIRMFDNDFIVVSWNEIPTNDGRVASLPARGNVGSTNVDFRNVPEGNIPGYASFFWIIPDHNIYATLRFSNTLLNGNQNFIRYINGFLKAFTDNVELVENEDGSTTIEGYKENHDSAVMNLRPSFKARPYRIAGDIDYIKQNHHRIQKVIRRKYISLDQEVQLELWQRLLEYIGVSDPRQPNGPTPVEYTLPYHPTRDDIEDMEVEWREFNEGRWDDVGFKMTNEPNKIYWFSNSLVQYKANLEIRRMNDEMINIDSIAESLSRNRERILSIVPRD